MYIHDKLITRMHIEGHIKGHAVSISPACNIPPEPWVVVTQPLPSCRPPRWTCFYFVDISDAVVHMALSQRDPGSADNV